MRYTYGMPSACPELVTYARQGARKVLWLPCAPQEARYTQEADPRTTTCGTPAVWGTRVGVHINTA